MVWLNGSPILPDLPRVEEGGGGQHPVGTVHTTDKLKFFVALDVSLIFIKGRATFLDFQIRMI
jgi:hypothetical protein